MNGGGAVPVRVGTENGNQTVCFIREVVNLAGLHIALGVHVNACGLVENLDISGRLHHTVEGVTTFFQPYATHFKADDEVTLFDESVVEVAAGLQRKVVRHASPSDVRCAVHACIAGSADRAGRWVQAGDFGGHVLIGGRGHVDTVARGVFED